jgi:outer membrane protein assembly factor BamB
MKRKIGWALLGLVVAGCGGGGGGTSGGGTTSQGMQLSFTPGTLETSFYQGEAQALEVSAQAGGVLPSPGTIVNVGIIDSAGVLETNARVLQTSDTAFRATLNPAQTLSAGLHTGSIVVRVCQDDPLICAKPIAGSPWNLPYRFTVQSQTNARDMERLPDAANYYGSASHNAGSSVTLDPSRFDRRWSIPTSSDALPPAAGNGLLTVAIMGLSKLVSYSERDGSQVWGRQLDAGALSGPTFAGDRLFLITNGTVAPWRSVLLSLDAVTGQTLAQVTLSAQLSASANPVVRDGKVYVCTAANSLARFDALTLKQEWVAPLEGDSYSPTCSPAVDDRYAYVYRGAGLQAIELATGLLAFSIATPADAVGPPTMQQAPVVGANGRVYMALWSTGYSSSPRLPRLLAFDIAKRTLAWSVSGDFNSNVVVGGDAVYITNDSRQLEARSLETGQLQWSWVSEGPIGGTVSPLMVVGKHALVTSNVRTFAVDLATHRQVWRDEGGGPLTLSPNGVLYIQRQFGDGIRAFNLR